MPFQTFLQSCAGLLLSAQGCPFCAGLLQNPATRFTRVGTANAVTDFVAIAAKKQMPATLSLVFWLAYIVPLLFPEVN